jgi:hypothetical protein
MTPGRLGFEFIRIAQAFVLNEFDIFAAKRMGFARREVPKDILKVPRTFGSR